MQEFLELETRVKEAEDAHQSAMMLQEFEAKSHALNSEKEWLRYYNVEKVRLTETRCCHFVASFRIKSRR
jgi:hypothetical protein